MKILNIERQVLDHPIPVYDLTSPKYHNFALANGCVVHNSAKKARDPKFQEVLPLTGKIANSERAKLHKLLESKAVQDILTSIGYNFDSHKKDTAQHKVRINKVILLPDADEDGNHIAVLLLTLFNKLMPQLYEEGKVYVVDAPLFNAYFKGKRYFGATLEEVKKQLPKACKVQIIRSKGWGEISYETLSEVAFNPKTRSLVQVKPIKGKELKYFEALVGNDSLARKQLLGL